MGDSREEYIHIHPARYAKDTVRVKANSLKTAILLAKHGIYNFQDLEITELNSFRKKLSLSPIRSLKAASGIKEVLGLITHQ